MGRRTGRTTTTTTTTTQLFLVEEEEEESRRRFLQRMTAAAVTLFGTTTVVPQDAQAGGLLQFPIPPSCPLKNIYHFLRAGPSELEIQGIYSTNALFLTNRDNALHVPTGEPLLDEALIKLQQQPPTIAFHSLAANAMDTGDYIARKLQMGREKLLPEFTYLDPRGTGLWNDSEESIVKPAIWALDVMEGGDRGMNGRPPPTIDGTPNETLNDQFVRLRQFLSLQESRTSGDVILVIFPDGTGPALLSCMIAGIPYKDCHALEFQPGEVRLNITPESVRQLYEQRKEDPVYLETIERGKVELKTLLEQQNEDATTVVSLKERREDKVQADIELAYQEKKRKDAALEVQQRNEQIERQRQMETEYAERTRVKKQRQEQEDRETKARRAPAVPAPSKAASKEVSSSSLTPTMTNDPNSPSLPAMVGLGAVGLGALGLLAMASGGGGGGATAGAVATGSNGNGNDDDNGSVISTRTSSSPNLPAMVPEQEEEEAPVRINVKEQDAPIRTSVVQPTNPTLSSQQDPTVWVDQKTSDDSQRDPPEESPILPLSSQSVEETLHQLAMAEQAMMDALVEAGQTTKKKGSAFLYDSPVPTMITRPNDDNLYDDDDGDDDDWLRVLAEIRDEEDEEQVLLINGNNTLYNEL